MHKRSRVILAFAFAAALVAGGGPALTAQQTGSGQAPAFRSGVEVVTVDVSVVDKQGNPLLGLTPADFVVTVARRPRQVFTAEYLARGPVAASAPLRPAADAISTNDGGGTGRLFAFIVDQNTLDVGSARRVAEASAPFMSRLAFADRSALMLMPVGPNVGFTWAHERVREGMQKATGMGRMTTEFEYGSLSEARDIANRNPLALRSLEERSCGTTSASAIGDAGVAPGGASSGGGAVPPSSGAASGGAAGGGAPAGGAAGGTAAGGAAGTGTARGGGGGGGGSPRSSTGGGSGNMFCARGIQMEAEAAWRMALLNSQASISALRQFLAALGRVRGDKTVILISGGWPLDERDELTMLSTVASEAAAARATLHAIYVPPSQFSSERRTMSRSPVADSFLYAGPLETLAAMSGGASFRAEAGASGAFERLGRELAGYYRIGIEKEPADGDGKGRRLKVQVGRGGATVRAREIFDVGTYEDRDWAARLASALDGPVPATDIGLRVTSYVSADAEDRSRRRLLLAGEMRRAQPGDATLRVVVNDLQGNKITGGEATLTSLGGDAMSFSTNLAVPPGSYIVRLGVMDHAGRVGSVDHRVEIADVPLGALVASGPVLVRVPGAEQGDASLALDTVRQDERLAIEVGLDGDPRRLEDTAVEFEIAAGADGPALVRTTAALSRGSREGLLVAQGVADMRVLPPGTYEVRARVNAGSAAIGSLRRGFSVTSARPASLAATPAAARAGAGGDLSARVARLPVAAVPSFSLDQVLAPPALGAFLENVAGRPDTAAGMRELLERARTSGLGGLVISNAQAAATPAGAFLRGLTLLAAARLDPAAAAFRDAMRQSADFYPAMIYLGACYAAGGKDKEAAAVWRTALIRENDTPALHAMLADALLRQGLGDAALDDLITAHARWPDDAGLQRRYAVAALLGGRHAEGLQALDELLATQGEDERSLAVALLILYEAFESQQPIESVERDRARMLRFADAYRTRGGPSVALIDTWLAVAAGKL